MNEHPFRPEPIVVERVPRWVGRLRWMMMLLSLLCFVMSGFVAWTRFQLDRIEREVQVRNLAGWTLETQASEPDVLYLRSPRGHEMMRIDDREPAVKAFGGGGPVGVGSTTGYGGSGGVVYSIGTDTWPAGVSGGQP